MENKNEIINSAIDLIAKGEFSKAAELLEKIQPENENDIETIKNLGLCYINTQEYQKAAQAFKKVLEIDENDATALYYLANCEEKLGFEDEAAQKYQKVLNLRNEFFDAYKNLAVILTKQGQHEKVIELLSPVIKIKNDDYIFYYFISSAYIALAKHNEAIEPLKKAIELRPDHLQLQNNLANCYIALNELENAELILKSAYAQNKDFAMTNYNLGVLYQIKGDYKKAFDYFNTAYKKEPSVSLMATLAYCARRAGIYELSVSLYRSLVAIYPDKANYQNNLLSVLMEMRKYQEALKTVKDLLKLNPKGVDLLKKYAALLRLTGSNENACEILDELIKRGKVDVEIYYNLAICRANMGDLEGSKDAFLKCIALEPHNPFVHKDLGLLYLKINMVDWAQDELNQAVELEPDEPEITFAYAVMLNKIGDFKKADEFYSKTVTLDKNNANYLAHWGENLVAQAKMDEGVEKLQAAIKLDPKNYIALYNLSKIYFAQKKYSVAKQILEDMLNIKKDSEILNMLGLCYLKTKDYKAAIGIFEKLRKDFPKNHILLCNLGECYLKLGEFEKAKEAANAALLIFSDYDEALKIIKEVEKQNDRG